MLKRCLAPDCHARSNQSYCQMHKPYAGNWQSTSAAVLRRDNHHCQCKGCNSCDGLYCRRPATTVDHIDGNPLNNNPEQLRALCRSCNTAKGGIA